jgi:hypothetical protein
MISDWGRCELRVASGGLLADPISSLQPSVSPEDSPQSIGVRYLARFLAFAPTINAMRDREELFSALARSAFRRRFRLRRQELEYLQAKGLATVLDHARDFIRERLAPAAPSNDGRQTPMRGHPAFVAQHATGACCRTCLAKWHYLAKGVQLSPREIDYVVGVLGAWLSRQAAGEELSAEARSKRRPREEQQELF